jgi:hypothetical protein
MIFSGHHRYIFSLLTANGPFRLLSGAVVSLFWRGMTDLSENLFCAIGGARDFDA